jgi:hypothetical protein
MLVLLHVGGERCGEEFTRRLRGSVARSGLGITFRRPDEAPARPDRRAGRR